jgi:hypothetical protein
MAVPANTLQTVASLNNAEDVTNAIYMVSKMDHPLTSLAGSSTADATYTEWPIDALPAINLNNATIEGDDAALSVATTPSRVGNYCQTLNYAFGISTQQQAIRKYGVSDEKGRQTFKFGKAIANDFEAIIMNNQARVVGGAGTAAKLRGLPSWITTNVSRGATGANGSASTAATDGTQRNFIEALFKGVIVSCATNSNAMPTVVMAGITGRANLSSQLSGNTTRFNDMMDSTLNASITVYRSDYGNLKLVPNVRMRERDMFFISPDYIKIRTLEPLQRKKLADTGLSEKYQMWMNKTLEVSNEAAHGVLADLNTAIL